MWVVGAVLGSFIGAVHIEPCLHLLMMERAMERKARCLPGLPFPKQVFEQGRVSKTHPGPLSTGETYLSIKVQGYSSFGSAVHRFGL